MANQGEGDPTDNAKAFFQWIQEVDQVQNMKQFRFTVFGLGNTQYEHYNKMGRLANKILNDVGAKRYYQ